MKFLIDAQLPPRLGDLLSSLGFTPVHVEAIGHRHSADAAILAWAAEHQHVLVTKDRDFASSSHVDVHRTKIVWIRTGNIPNGVLLERVSQNWTDVIALLQSGQQIVEFR